MQYSRATPMLIAAAGLLGALGVSFAAAAAHVDGSIALRAAAEMALVHAATAIALVAFAHHAHRAPLWRWIAAALLTGASLFSVSVGLGVLADFRPFPALAPIGGTFTIVAWLAVVAAGVFEAASVKTK